jgi:hypothetical protein
MLVSVVIFSSLAHAKTLRFDGVVTSVGSPLAGTFHAGDQWWMEIDYNTGALDSDGSSSVGNYPGAITRLLLGFNNYDLSAAGGLIVVENEPPVLGGQTDILIFNDDTRRFPITAANVAGLIPFFVSMELTDNNKSVFSSDAISQVMPPLNEFESRVFEFGFAESVQQFFSLGVSNVFGVVTSAIEVPEPSAGTMIVVSAVILLLGGHRLQGRRSIARVLLPGDPIDTAAK